MSNPSTGTDDSFSLKEKLQYTFLGVIVLGGSFYLGKKILKGAKANAEERKTFVEGSEATYAKQIKMAFENDGWWGTDEVALRNVLRKIASKQQLKSVISSYEKLYGSSMLKDMKDELQSTEYNEMLAIIAAKPDSIGGNYQPIITSVNYQSWARRLKAAFDIKYGPFPGTDEDAIKAVFMELPSQAAFFKVAQAYKQEYGNDLMSDLQSELEFWEFSPMMAIINAKPKV